MKKRIFALLLIAAMSFSLLAGCGSKDDEKTPDTENTPGTSAPADPSFSADLAEFYNKIMAAAEEGPFMMDIAAEAEFMENFYPGLKDIETKQLVAYTPAMTGVAVEFVFVEVANAADVDAVKAILQARVDDQKTEGMGKYPTTTVVWEKHSEIVTIDNYVCLFVCTEKDGMIDAFRNGTEVPAWAKAQAPAEGEGDIEGGVGDMEPTVPSEDEIPAFDPEAETSTAPVEPEPSVAPSTPAVEPETPAVEPSAPAATSIDLDAFYNELYAELYPLDAEGFATGPASTDLMNPNPDFGITPEDGLMMIDMYFPGLTAIEANQLHVFFCPMSFSAYEVVLIELANESDADAVKTILQARIDAQAAGGAWYQEAVDGWINDSRIVTNGSYIMMAVGADCDTFVARFNAQF